MQDQSQSQFQDLEAIERHISETLPASGIKPPKSAPKPFAKGLTFEKVDEQVNKHFAKQQLAAPAGAVSVDQLKGIYAVVRPILLLVEQMSILSKTVKTVFHLFIVNVDYLVNPPKSASKSEAGKSVSIDKLKGIYAVVRPILLMLAGFPFIPAKWKQAVQTFVTALDVITGQIS